jgi:galactarate dehydratase
MHIRVNPRDNVAIIVDPEGFLSGQERIPQAHKMALQSLDLGEPVVRYGETIGFANRRIEAGAWVREELVDMPAARPLDDLPLATAVPNPLTPLDGYTF